MALTTKQLGFLLFFLLSWLLLLLLGESYLSYLLFGAISLGLVFFSKHLDWSRWGQRPGLVVMWVLFLLGLGVSAILTVSWPLTLYAVSRLLLVTVLFWFFYLLKPQFVSVQLLLKALLLLGLVMVVISVAFRVLPEWANLLPGMNLLHASYGHNHLAALMLLLLPPAWWLALNELRGGGGWSWWLLPLSFTLALVTSFGRVAITLGLIQLLVLWRWWLPIRYVTHQSAQAVKIRRWFWLVTGLFVVVLFSKVFFSLATVIKPDFICPVPPLEKQLCKSITTEVRPSYWRWAVEMVKGQPWWGFGPGTFEIVAPRYHLRPDISTAYAHNAYLQTMGELGLIGGGLFVSLMLFLLFLSLKLQVLNLKPGNFQYYKTSIWKLRLRTLKVSNLKPGSLQSKPQSNQPPSWQSAVFLGVATLYVDVLFDFDWSFVGLLGLSVVFLSWLIRIPFAESTDTKSINLAPIKNNMLQFRWKLGFKSVFYLLSFSLICVAGLYAVTERLIRTDRADQAFELFPYFHWHRKIFEQDPSLTTNQRWQLLNIYGAHPELYRSLLVIADDPRQKQDLKQTWVELDPWQLVKQDLITYYLEAEDWLAAEEQLAVIYDFVNRAEIDSEFELDYQKKVKLAEQMLRMADGLYGIGRPQSAAQWYVRSRWADDWQLDQHPPVFLTAAAPPQVQLEFLQNLDSIPGQYFGQYQADYATAYAQTLRQLIATQDQAILANSLQFHSEQILAIADWSRWQLWTELASPIINQAEARFEQREFEDSYQLLMALAKTWSVLSQEGQYQLEWQFQEQLAQLLVKTGNQLAKNHMPQTLIAYQQAQQLVPWISSLKPYFLTLFEPTELSMESLKTYLDQTYNLNAEKIGWKTKERTVAFTTLIKKLVTQKSYREALAYARLTPQILDLHYEPRAELAVWLQANAVEALEEVKALEVEQHPTTEQLKTAQQLTEMMHSVLPEDYWVAVQPANLAVLQEDYELAKKLFEACLENYVPGYEPEPGFRHDDCYYGLQDLNNGTPNQERYLQVSQIIRGEAVR